MGRWLGLHSSEDLTEAEEAISKAVGEGGMSKVLRQFFH